MLRAFTQGAVDPLGYFSFQPVLHNRCNKGHCMCYPVCGMVHIKEPCCLLERVAHVAAVGFLSHYLNGPLPECHITVTKCVECVNAFYLQLYGVRHMVKNHSDSERKPAAATWATLSD